MKIINPDIVLEVLYRDEWFIAINKPCGLLVHRTRIAEEDTVFALQILRDQIGCHLYPVHRIDRPTSGILLFAFTPEVARALNEQLVSHQAEKIYTALVRGWMREPISLDHSVKNENGNMYEAQTDFKPLRWLEVPISAGKYPHSRYSVIECRPFTGRWHQIRQHLAHLRHYIINDRVHGDNKHNKLYTSQLGIYEMFLHATTIALDHPIKKERLHIAAPFPPHWERIVSYQIDPEKI